MLKEFYISLVRLLPGGEETVEGIQTNTISESNSQMGSFEPD